MMREAEERQRREEEERRRADEDEVGWFGCGVTGKEQERVRCRSSDEGMKRSDDGRRQRKR